MRWQYMIAAACLGWAFYGDKLDLTPKPDVPAIVAPSVELQPIVASISKLLAGHKSQAADLSAFYDTAADAVRRDGAGENVLKTNAQLRMFLERSAKLRFQGDFEKVPGLSDAIYGKKGALAATLGLEQGNIDHAKAVIAISAVAWACQEAAK